MTTAEHLQSMTDRSKFEQLAGAILSIKFPELSNLIVGGINAKGETTKGPLDAFAKVKTDQYAFIEYTTDDSNLEKKWLHDSSVPVRASKANPKGVSTAPDGDLIKAAKYFKAILIVEPTAKLDIYLVTNQQVDDDLWLAVMAAATDLNVSAIIIPLTTLSQFLDTNPLGQYLRYKYLNITAELPSFSLLQTIAAKNQSAYKDENYIEHGYVPRVQEELLLREHLSSGNLLTFLIADSGMGKTMVSANLMFFFTEAGNLAIRLDPKYIETSSDIVDALYNQLNFHHKQLVPGKELLLACLANKKILVIVDDINRITDTRTAINKLISWQKPQEGNVPIQVLCPLWNRNYQFIDNKDRKKQYYASIFLGTYTETEAVNAVLQRQDEASPLTEIQAKAIARSLKNDPLLIGLYHDAKGTQKQTVGDTTLNILKGFIDDHLSTIEQDEQHLLAESWQALIQLGAAMLSHYTLLPRLHDITTWLSGEDAVIIKTIALKRALFYFDKEGSIVFRHDRVRDSILSYALAAMLTRPPEYTQAQIILDDPYYSELTGQAIALAKPPVATVEHILSVLPLAVYTALTYLDPHGDYYTTIFELLEQWNKANPAAELKPLESYEISWLLLFSDIPNLSKILKRIEREHFTPLAKFRNGDFSGAVEHLSHWVGIEPELNDVIRDEIFDHVRQKNYLTVQNLTVANVGKNVPVPRLVAALYLLSGYWRSAATVVPVMQSWERDTANKELQFINVLWAVVNSFDNATLSELYAILEHWDHLPDEPENNDGFFESGPKGKIMHKFGLIRWHFNTEQITALISLAEQGRFVDLVDVLLSHMDHPLAIDYIVRSIGKTKRLYPGSMYDSEQPDNRWQADRTGRPLSAESKQLLYNIWTTEHELLEDRKVAFRFWCDSSSPEDKLPVLVNIKREDEMYLSVVYERCRLGDKDTLTDIVAQLPSRPWHLRFVKFIWSKQANEAVVTYLLSVDDQQIKTKEIDFLLGDLINSLGRDDASLLLQACWDKYSSYAPVVQQAFYIASPQSLAMAAKVIDVVEDPSGFFKYIGLVMHRHQFPQNGEPLSIAQLEGLCPYFNFIDEHTLNGLALNANAQHRQWMLSYIFPLLNEKDKQHLQPSDTDLLAELKGFITDHPYHVRLDRWLDELPERKCNLERLTKVLEDFIAVEHSFNGLLIVGRCVEKKGRRPDIQLLERYSVSPQTLSDPQSIIDDFKYSIKRNRLS